MTIKKKKDNFYTHLFGRCFLSEQNLEVNCVKTICEWK